MDKQLKPCPFCGHKASLRQEQVTVKKYKPIMSIPDYSIGYSSKSDIVKYKVLCNKCKASVGLYASDKTAIVAWNRRVDDGREAKAN